MDDGSRDGWEAVDDGTASARRFWRRVVLPIAAAGAVAMGLAGGGLAYIHGTARQGEHG